MQYQILTIEHDPIFGEEITIKIPVVTNTKQEQNNQYPNIIRYK